MQLYNRAKQDGDHLWQVETMKPLCQWSLNEAWGAMYSDDGEDEEAA
jgi:hypothetical protein